MTQTPTITRRPALPEDEEFLRRVYDSTRMDELSVVPWTDAQKAEFLAMQFQAQHTYYHAQFPDAEYDLLLQDGTPIGRLYLDRRPGTIQIMDIALLPEYRNQGIGTHLIRSIMHDAAAQGLSVGLHVELFNPAQNLYARLGFLPVQEDGIYRLMEWNNTHALSSLTNS